VAHGINELVSFIHAKVTNAVADDDGSLHITFGDHGMIDVPFDANYEAWTYSHPGGFLASPPGGGL
jgi:hypothetical protein